MGSNTSSPDIIRDDEKISELASGDEGAYVYGNSTVDI
jgi:hypothetical protein